MKKRKSLLSLWIFVWVLNVLFMWSEKIRRRRNSIEEIIEDIFNNLYVFFVIWLIIIIYVDMFIYSIKR